MGCQVLRSVLRSGLAGPGSGSGGSSSSPDEVPCLKSRTPVLNLVRLLPRLHTHTVLAPTAPSDTAPRGRSGTPLTLVGTLSVLRISTLPRSRERIPTCWQCSSAMPIRCCRLCTSLAHSKRLLPRNPIASFPSSSIICSPVMYIARSVFWLASTHVAQYRGQTFARGCKVPIAPQRCSVMSNERKYKNVVLSSGLVNRSAICSLVGTQLTVITRFR